MPIQDRPDLTDVSDARAGQSEQPVPWYRRLGGAFQRPDPGNAISLEIVAALSDVTASVSDARCVEDVLTTIADRAKLITGAEKAAVVLTDEGETCLDVDTVVVRGQMDRHLQDWWLERLGELCADTFSSGEAVVERHEEDRAWLVCAPLRIREQPVGLLAVINSAERPFTDLQVAMLAVLSAFAASSIEAIRLVEHGRSLVLEAERERIARELHDGIVQSLFSISLGLEACKKQTLRDPTGVANRLSGIQQELTTAMGELRRLVYDLRPMDVRTLGVAGAIRRWIQRVGEQSPIRGRLVVVGDPYTLSAQDEACLYAVAKEAVSNVVRHANAGTYEVRLEYEAGVVRLSITDDGQGFDLAEAFERGESGCLGLMSMRQRVDKLGGSLAMDSQPGRGATIAAVLQTGSR